MEQNKGREEKRREGKTEKGSYTRHIRRWSGIALVVVVGARRFVLKSAISVLQNQS
jgi:hypothetical protein